jgi:hypothetical protein
MFIAALLKTLKIWTAPWYPLTDVWRESVVHTDNGLLLIHNKRMNSVIFKYTVELVDSMLSKIIQVQKVQYYMSSMYMETEMLISEKQVLHGSYQYLMGCRGGGREEN